VDRSQLQGSSNDAYKRKHQVEYAAFVETKAMADAQERTAEASRSVTNQLKNRQFV
jgi:hypothetical protein